MVGVGSYVKKYKTIETLPLLNFPVIRINTIIQYLTSVS